MWADFNPKALTRPQFVERIKKLVWGDWLPIGIVIHNTAAPTLAQWAESGPKHAARIKNLQAYYEGMGWHGGPHWFISRNWINEFSNPLRRGTHSPSFNAQYFGIEMVGDYAREPFNSDDGALVRDNTAYVVAALCWRFGFNPRTDIKLHKEDPRTNHDCPGKNVVKADFIDRVIAEMKDMAVAFAKEPAVVEVPEEPPFRFTGITATVFSGPGELQASAYGGMVNPLGYGVALPAKFKGQRRKVRVWYKDKSVDCFIVDVGPWVTDDAYWDKGTRPTAEIYNKTQQPLPRGPNKGRVPNAAGIDLTPAAGKALGLPATFKVQVDWAFIEEK